MPSFLTFVRSIAVMYASVSH